MVNILKKLHNEHGYILPITLLVVVVLALLITSTATVVVTDFRQSQWEKNRTAAFYLAESGINHALYRLIEKGDKPDTSYPDGIPSYISSGNYNFGPDNKFEVWVESNGTAYTITSVGTSKGRKKILQQKVTAPGTLFPKSVVNTGDDDENYEIHEVKLKTTDLPAEELTVNGNQIISGNLDYHYSSIKVEEEGSLTFVGDKNIFVDGSVTIENGGTIQINGNGNLYIGGSVSSDGNLVATGDLNIYINGSLLAKDSSVIGNNPDPSKTVLYFSTDTNFSGNGVQLDNKSIIRGGIYAPTREVKLKGNYYLNALVCNKVNGNTKDIIWDERMKNIGGKSWSIGAWSEIN